MSESNNNEILKPIAHDEIRACVAKEIKKIVMKKPQEILWHYTDTKGFSGIVNSNALHFTNIRFLNDSREFLHAIDIMRDVAGGYRERHPEAEAKLILDSLLSEMLIATDKFVPTTFICCFSEVENDLSQWRAYGGKLGISIGFNTSGFYQKTLEQDVDFLPCEYDIENQVRMLATVVGNLVMVFLEHGSKIADVGENLVQLEAKSLVSTFLRNTGQMTATFKHHGFWQEREWRLIAFNPPSDNIEVSANAESLAPFLPVSAKSGRKLPIGATWIGPGRNNNISYSSVRWLLQKQGFGELPAYISDIPFRQGV